MMNSKEKKIKISFLVPTLGERIQELKRLFDSLKIQKNDEIEVIVIAQGNYEQVREIISNYSEFLNIIMLESYEKGLSRARNLGMTACNGEIVVLSDDDCWYAKDAVEFILSEMREYDILLTQIKDFENNVLYKKYPEREEIITSKYKLLSKSSIEIAFRIGKGEIRFDENFGLGARFVAGEENDFLLNMHKKGAKIKYIPKVTVYHPKKNRVYNSKSSEARGAFYAKNFNWFIACLICFRDLIIRKQNIFRDFYRGYYEYYKRNN